MSEPLEPLYSSRTDWLGNPDVETDFDKLVAYATDPR